MKRIIILKKLLIIKCKNQTERKLVEQTLKTVVESMDAKMTDVRVPVGGGFRLGKGNF